MSENFVIEIISPDKSILKSEAIEVTIPAYEGQMGILKDPYTFNYIFKTWLNNYKTTIMKKKLFLLKKEQLNFQ